MANQCLNWFAAFLLALPCWTVRFALLVPLQVLMWEICKTSADAAKEFDRTMDYIQDTVVALQQMYEKSKETVTTGGILGNIGRGPIGVMVCIGPFNYPFNETYCQFIPSLMMGNTVVMKIPRTGGLAHLLTIEVCGCIRCLFAGAAEMGTHNGRWQYATAVVMAFLYGLLLSCRVALWCAVLCRALVCCAVLCWAVLCFAVLCSAELCSNQRNATQHSAAQCNTA